MMATQLLTATCRRGAVAVETIGWPIVTAVCDCAHCQRGSRQIEALPDAGPARNVDGGATYILCRKDRIRCTQWSHLVRNGSQLRVSHNAQFFVDGHKSLSEEDRI
jgi:hypothetical protein